MLFLTHRFTQDTQVHMMRCVLRSTRAGAILRRRSIGCRCVRSFLSTGPLICRQMVIRPYSLRHPSPELRPLWIGVAALIPSATKHLPSPELRPLWVRSELSCLSRCHSTLPTLPPPELRPLWRRASVVSALRTGLPPPAPELRPLWIGVRRRPRTHTCIWPKLRAI